MPSLLKGKNRIKFSNLRKPVRLHNQLGTLKVYINCSSTQQFIQNDKIFDDDSIFQFVIHQQSAPLEDKFNFAII